MDAAPTSLQQLVFDNRYFNELPADPEPDNFRRQVYNACYSAVLPTPVCNPQLVAFSSEIAEQLGLDTKACESDQFTQVFTGNELLEGMQPYAQCYGGHQFGHWAGQLGDGRAINLGEAICPDGERLTLQLKGAGPTPYSRSADGLAVLRSSVREFLCSEAMFHLGVPTTRALSLTLTGEQVVRDMFYDGHPKEEPGAVVCRVAPSFTRFGNFQIFAARDDIENLKKLADFTLKYDFPEIKETGKEGYLALFREVCRRTAVLATHWQRVGFVHGVLNTDNMSILGLTIDYGPYGWIDNFDPGWTPNTTDAQGRRYRFGHQPQIAHWNLLQLANALFPLVREKAPFKEALEQYANQFDNGWWSMMCVKLGLNDKPEIRSGGLVDELMQLLQLTETDMTIFFRKLAKLTPEEKDETPDSNALLTPLMEAYYQPDEVSGEIKTRITNWLRNYLEVVRKQQLDPSERLQLMNRTNPKYVLRNYLAQQAIDKAEQGDFSMINELLDLLRFPYSEQPERQRYFAKRPDWARHKPGCSMLSCSS